MQQPGSAQLDLIRRYARTLRQRQSEARTPAARAASIRTPVADDAPRFTKMPAPAGDATDTAPTANA